MSYSVFTPAMKTLGYVKAHCRKTTGLTDEWTTNKGRFKFEIGKNQYGGAIVGVVLEVVGGTPKQVSGYVEGSNGRMVPAFITTLEGAEYKRVGKFYIEEDGNVREFPKVPEHVLPLYVTESMVKEDEPLPADDQNPATVDEAKLERYKEGSRILYNAGSKNSKDWQPGVVDKIYRDRFSLTLDAGDRIISVPVKQVEDTNVLVLESSAPPVVAIPTFESLKHGKN